MEAPWSLSGHIRYGDPRRSYAHCRSRPPFLKHRFLPPTEFPFPPLERVLPRCYEQQHGNSSPIVSFHHPPCIFWLSLSLADGAGHRRLCSVAEATSNLATRIQGGPPAGANADCAASGQQTTQQEDDFLKDWQDVDRLISEQKFQAASDRP